MKKKLQYLGLAWTGFAFMDLSPKFDTLCTAYLCIELEKNEVNLARWRELITTMVHVLFCWHNLYIYIYSNRETNFCHHVQALYFSKIDYGGQRTERTNKVRTGRGNNLYCFILSTASALHGITDVNKYLCESSCKQALFAFSSRKKNVNRYFKTWNAICNTFVLNFTISNQ